MLTTLLFVSLISQAPQAPAQPATKPALTVPPLLAPTREYVLPTGPENALLRSGIQFYERRDYDKALELFQQAATEFPTSMTAQYELALTYAARKDFQKAIDIAAKATDFKDPELARVYALIGNVLDMNGEPKRAVEVYRKGIEFATETTSTLYYNMGITYVEALKDSPAAKAAFKQSALVDPTHASTQLMLSKMFLRDDLRLPGLFAIGRFLILEPASTRIQEAYTLWYGVIRGNMGPICVPVGATRGVAPTVGGPAVIAGVATGVAAAARVGAVFWRAVAAPPMLARDGTPLAKRDSV
jgi:tetratricopeptide (TPR) repeat protein